jgi:hypothetical protein
MSNRVTKLLTAVILIGAPASALASPRTLANGAPACGNTMGKGGYNDSCTAEERAAARAEVARLEQEERAAYIAWKAQARAAKAKAGADAFATVLATALPWKIAPKG